MIILLCNLNIPKNRKYRQIPQIWSFWGFLSKSPFSNVALYPNRVEMSLFEGYIYALYNHRHFSPYKFTKRVPNPVYKEGTQKSLTAQ